MTKRLRGVLMRSAYRVRLSFGARKRRRLCIVVGEPEREYSMQSRLPEERPHAFIIPAQELEELLVEAGELLDRDERLSFACLFGSASEGSSIRDIDVGVYLVDESRVGRSRTSGSLRWEMENDLGRRLELRVREKTGVAVPVDLREIVNRRRTTKSTCG